jgi:hypothetical protein
MQEIKVCNILFELCGSYKKEEEGLVLNNNMSKPSNKQKIHVFRETQVLCIAKWQEYVSNIQRDLLALEG